MTEPAVVHSSTVRVLLVSDIRLYRDGLVRVLGEQAGLEIVGTISPGESLARAVTELRPHVVLVDVHSLRAENIATGIERTGANVRIIAFALDVEDEVEVLACAEAGVAGFVDREATMEELTSVIQTAVEGGVRCSPSVAAIVVRRVASLKLLQPSAAEHLTSREQQVLGLVEHGLSNKAIAQRLGIGLCTVKNHVHHILAKLHLGRRTEAVVSALRGAQGADGDGRPAVARMGRRSGEAGLRRKGQPPARSPERT